MCYMNFNSCPACASDIQAWIKYNGQNVSDNLIKIFFFQRYMWRYNLYIYIYTSILSRYILFLTYLCLYILSNSHIFFIFCFQCINDDHTKMQRYIGTTNALSDIHSPVIRQWHHWFRLKCKTHQRDCPGDSARAVARAIALVCFVLKCPAFMIYVVIINPCAANTVYISD